MGTWYSSLALSFFLVLFGLYTHWIVTLAGALLPFIPLIGMLASRRAAARRAGDATRHDG